MRQAVEAADATTHVQGRCVSTAPANTHRRGQPQSFRRTRIRHNASLEGSSVSNSMVYIVSWVLAALSFISILRACTSGTMSNAGAVEKQNAEKCRDPGSNRGPSDLQSDALPTELSRLASQCPRGPSHGLRHQLGLLQFARHGPKKELLYGCKKK